MLLFEVIVDGNIQFAAIELKYFKELKSQIQEDKLLQRMMVGLYWGTDGPDCADSLSQ